MAAGYIMWTHSSSWLARSECRWPSGNAVLYVLPD